MSDTRLGAALSFLERLFPPALTEEWDRSGLFIGDRNAPLSSVLVALDPSGNAVEEAIRQKADLLLTHHPLYLRPPANLDFSSAPASTIRSLIKNDISLYCAHTNLDRAEGGVNDFLARALGLSSVRPLSEGERTVKVVVTVPVGHEDSVADAMSRAGGGIIGNYTGCSFMASGTGQFTPGGDADPFIGEAGSPERADETRIEMTATKSLLTRVTDAARAAHPYEEPVIDVYELFARSATGSLGRIGELPDPVPLTAFAASVETCLGAGRIRFVGPDGAMVKSVAVVGGSGASLWRTAKAKGADVLVTGDLKYHEAKDALDDGFSIVDAGHWATEKSAVAALAAAMDSFSAQAGAGLRVSVFEEEDPFRSV